MTVRISNSSFLIVEPPLPVDAAGWEVRVISPHDWNTVIGYVRNWRKISGSTSLNDFGSGSIEMNTNNPILSTPFPAGLPGTIRQGEFLWQFWRDGVLRHEWISDDEKENEVGEAYDATISFSGRTLEKVLDWAVHRPIWGERQAIEVTGSPTGGTYKLTGNGENTVAIAWNATPAAVQTAIEGFSFVNPGDVTVRMSTESPTRYIIQFMGGLVGIDVPRLQATEVALTGGSDPGLDIPEESSNNSWTDLNSTIEGQPAIASVIAFIQRAQERGVLTFLDVAFSATHDSAGVAWSDITDVTVQPGETLLALLQRLCDMRGWEFKVYSGFKLWVVQDTYGSHRSQEVVFYKAGHQMKHERTSSSRDVVTDIFTQSAKFEVMHSTTTSTVTPWKREAWLEAGGSPSQGSAAAVGEATLAIRKDKQVSRTIQVPPHLPTRQIFIDYDLADYVTLETADGMEEVKVVGVSFSSDADEEFGLEIVIQSAFETREVRVQRALEAMGSKAAMGGQGSSPTGPAPIQRSIGVRDLTDVNLGGVTEGDILVRSGTGWVAKRGKITSLTDVDSTPATNGQALVWDSVLSKWKPGTVASSGGSGGSGGGGGSVSPAVVRASSSNYGTGGTSSVVVPGTAVVGDLLVITVHGNWNVSNTNVTGWTFIGAANGSNTNVSLFSKVCVSGDIGATVNFTMGGSEPWETACVAVQNANAVKGWKVQQSASSQTNWQLTSALTGIDATNDLILMSAGIRGGNTTVGFNAGTAVLQRTTDAQQSLGVFKHSGVTTLQPNGTASSSNAGMSMAVFNVGINTAPSSQVGHSIFEVPYPGVTTNTGADTEQSKGNKFFCMGNATITSATIYINSAAGKTYNLRLFEINPTSHALVAQIGTTVSVASPGALTKTPISTGTVSWNVDAGKWYCIILTTSDGSAWTSHYATAGATGRDFLGPNGIVTYMRVANTNPTVGTVFAPVSNFCLASQITSVPR